MSERLRAGGRILDAGCGAGYGLAAFAEAFPAAEVVGIEIDAASLGAARELASERAQVLDVHLLEAGFRDEFDLVWANISLSHTWGSAPDVFAALVAAARPGGYVLCSDVPYAEGLEELRSTAGRLFTGVTVYVSLLGFELLTPHGAARPDARCRTGGRAGGGAARTNEDDGARTQALDGRGDNDRSSGLRHL